MKISAIIASFRDALATAFPDAAVEDAKTVQTAIECVASAIRPLIVLTPGPRAPAQLLGSCGQYGGVANQTVLIFVAAPAGIVARGEKYLELADLAAEVEAAALNTEGDWTFPRWEASEPATLPGGFPLDAWLIKLSVTTSQYSEQPDPDPEP